MTKRIGFEAITRKDARVLILGTLPGEESLRRKEYYANRANGFWKIMGELIGATPDMSYADRRALLKKKRIALWDVCASAHRAGSLDSKIQSSTIMPNDFGSFFKTHKSIELICFNGQPAERLFDRIIANTLPASVLAIRRQVLPSTSPAHARMRFDEKHLQWRKVLDEFVE
jgi:hypoxanthine-DNA glycosylase